MTGSQRVAHLAAAIAVAAGSAVGFASGANASPCDPITLSMTPQPVLSCPDPAAPAPVVGASGPVPVVGTPLPDALPPPGQAPAIPPTSNADGTQDFGSDGFIGDVMNQFGNGVPSEFIYGPMAPPPPS
ncbi:hypothetical protein [Mycolicibacterium komossense]|uniref:Uncharacterized protein n=1 Tax=Mycolicibacterium komossense TaxID=1779 RepID=A0ABT3CAP8_9MYCO|nr:hypothetical protein [Mycolicibacterium komossense]MCV7226564.1 hypothetical protein [Mycolicibacterium komossense]